jgi:hypothetical protein
MKWALNFLTAFAKMILNQWLTFYQQHISPHVHYLCYLEDNLVFIMEQIQIYISFSKSLSKVYTGNWGGHFIHDP